MQIWEATDKTVSHRLTLSCRWLLFFGKNNRQRASGREISERKPFSMLNKWLCYIAEYPWSPNFEPEHQIQNSKEITVMICGTETFLFDEENGKWFVEGKKRAVLWGCHHSSALKASRNLMRWCAWQKIIGHLYRCIAPTAEHCFTDIEMMRGKSSMNAKGAEP